MPLLLLEIARHPPEGALGGAALGAGAAAALAAELADGDAHSGLGGDEGLVELLGQGAGVELGELVGGLEALDAGQLGLLGQAVPLGLVGLDALVDLLEGETGSADLGVLVGVGLYIE